MDEVVVVTRHKALVQYLIEKGIVEPNCNVIEHAKTSDVLNKHVIGVLPLSLAVHANRVTEVPLHIPAELRGQELTLDQVRQYAQETQTYTVCDTNRFLRFFDEACYHANGRLDSIAYFGAKKD